MSDPGTLHEPDGHTARTLEGFDVWAIDGDIGKVREHAELGPASYLVVDTASWVWGFERVIPAGVIEHVDDDHQRVHIRLCKAQVRSAPDLLDGKRIDVGRTIDCDYFDRWL